jgi:hypothetical protein
MLFSHAAFAWGVPECLSEGRDLPIDNEQVLEWKHSTANQFLARAHVEGTVSHVFNDHSDHEHFLINIGSSPDDTLEVIYNEDFGTVPQPYVGMRVEACGDYITSTEQTGQYPASPAGAIIHWVHVNPRGRGHDSGFLVMNGQVCGQGPEQGSSHGPAHGGDRRW